jgi:hypothetical protein
MPTPTASGSGAPPIGKDYGGEKILPRSGLLEPIIPPDLHEKPRRPVNLNGLAPSGVESINANA